MILNRSKPWGRPGLQRSPEAKGPRVKRAIPRVPHQQASPGNPANLRRRSIGSGADPARLGMEANRPLLSGAYALFVASTPPDTALEEAATLQTLTLTR